MENPRNQNGIGTKELLAVSFGTSYRESLGLTIDAVEQYLEKAFPSYSLRRAFTSPTIIRVLKERDGLGIDSVEEALLRAEKNGVRMLAVQPTHMMSGLEYQGLVKTVRAHEASFLKVSVGAPLLSTRDDFQRVLQAVTEDTEQYDDGRTAICLMGHGTTDRANEVYELAQELLFEAGCDNYFIGTVEADPTLDQVVSKVREGDYKRVVLQPFMLVAGDHANQDMAGMGSHSWKRTFEEAGYEVHCVLKGLGQLPKIREIFVDHAREAIKKLEAESTNAPENA